MEEKQYIQLIRPYSDALESMTSRLKILKHSLYDGAYGQPIQNIQSRIKSKSSIEGKLLRQNIMPTFENAREYLQDIAGIRAICFYQDDIYNLIQNIKSQSDLICVRESDYISHPKPNGYRSYHLILGVPIYYMDLMDYFPVELQLRTISMDFWASMEHRILYKKETSDRE